MTRRGEFEGIQYRIEVEFEILPFQQRIPRTKLPINVHGTVAQHCLQLEIEEPVVPMALVETLDIKMQWFLAFVTLEDDADTIDVDLFEDDIEPWSILLFLPRRRLYRQDPVRVPVGRIRKMNHRIIDIDQLDENGSAYERPEIETDLEPSHGNHVGPVGPVGVRESNVFGDYRRVPRKVDQQVAVDRKLASGLLGDQALDLRLEYAEVGRPQPRERKHDGGEQYKEGPEEELPQAHRAIISQDQWGSTVFCQAPMIWRAQRTTSRTRGDDRS